MSKSADDAPGLVKIDPWLEPYSAAIHQRTARYQQKLQEYGPLSEFATSHKDLGLHRNGNEWVFREWAPRAKGLFLTGDFCDWSREAHPLRRSREIGVWDGRCGLRTEISTRCIELEQTELMIVCPHMLPFLFKMT